MLLLSLVPPMKFWRRSICVSKFLGSTVLAPYSLFFLKLLIASKFASPLFLTTGESIRALMVGCTVGLRALNCDACPILPFMFLEDGSEPVTAVGVALCARI